MHQAVHLQRQVERIAHAAFKLAQQRDRRLTSVDKSNVLEVSQLWREVVTRVGEGYPDVELSHMCAASCAPGQPKPSCCVWLPASTAGLH